MINLRPATHSLCSGFWQCSAHLCFPIQLLVVCHWVSVLLQITNFGLLCFLLCVESVHLLFCRNIIPHVHMFLHVIGIALRHLYYSWVQIGKCCMQSSYFIKFQQFYDFENVNVYILFPCLSLSCSLSYLSSLSPSLPLSLSLSPSLSLSLSPSLPLCLFSRPGCRLDQ